MNRIVRSTLVVAVGMCGASGLAADETPPPRRLSLEQALREAFARSPALAAYNARLEEAEARRVTAGTYPHDPTLSVEGADRDGGGDSDTDWAVRVTQPVEIGGQRRRRVAEAAADLDAAGAALEREKRLLAARVRAIFVEALRARELLEVERANAELVGSLADVARKRFEAGSVPQMEVNLAQVQVGRAQRNLQLARAAYRIACAALAEAVGLDPVQPPEPDGELELPRRAPVPVERLVEGALRHRADLEAFRSTIESARARIEVARREAVPDLVVEGFYEREDGDDRLRGGGIGIRIPLFDRNRGAVAEARAAERRAVADTEAAVLRVRREVAEARARYDAAFEVAATLEEQVLDTLEDSLKLLQRSFEAGKTGWTEALIFRRELIDIKRDYVDSLADARLAGIELDLAAGRALAAGLQ
jgi:cobalt-zinc-cadmium efflux system outer membrane protein